NPLDDTELERIGAQDFILKPFETSEISEKVHGYLNHLSSPPTRDEESFFTPKYSPEKNNIATTNRSSHAASTESSYDIGFSSVDDIALTDAEVNVKAIAEDESQDDIYSSNSPEISDFAFDNSDLSGIDVNSNLDSISGSNTTQHQELNLETTTNESTDINFSQDFQDILEANADSFHSKPEQKEPNYSPLSPETNDQIVNAEPVETDVIEHLQKTETSYPSDHSDLQSFDDIPVSNHNFSSENSVQNLQLSDQQIESIVTKVFEKVIERIAWEVVPDIAEKMIREEISRLTKD
ncbi:MAG TPA: hypothetical protein PKB05_09050, partial [Oligoflexia bacterium]|nr:hypothetical protein [Oligoflexia bacterium]